MDLNLKDKVIIVSGTAGSLDEHLINMLAAEGAVPAVIDNEVGDLKINEAFTSTGGKYLQVITTLSKPENCKAVIEKILEYTGGIYGLVNYACSDDAAASEAGRYEQFMASLYNNLVPHYLLTQHALPALKVSKGVIVNIISAMTPKTGNNAYAAVNDGVKALTREWAVEVLKYNIRVNAVLARNNQNEEIANMIAFLLSEKSSHTTGQIINCS